MNPTINRLKIVFLILFAIGTVGIWSYQIFYVWPAHRCDERGGWWDRKARVCAAPIYIPDITGRPKGMSRKEWSEKQAARQIQRDQEGYPTASATPAPPAARTPAPAPPATK
ncbi:MAG: hypothetical protein Q7U20_03490 [Caulobacter sp.]|nr:hypothetical protein [Caulobacter sp.]